MRTAAVLERAMGIEPTTYSLGSCRSTTELRPQNLSFLGLLPAICLLNYSARKCAGKF